MNSCATDNKFAKRVYDLIPSGEANAITAAELANILQVPWRIITATIHFLRCKDFYICSCGKGYFRPENNDELRHFVMMMRSRRKHIKAAAASAEKLLKQGGLPL